jgi:hypothetical protein
MSDDQPVRPAPRIIQVPPPRAPLLEAACFWPLAPVMWFVLIGLFTAVGKPLVLLGACILLVSVWDSSRRCARFNRARRNWLERRDSAACDPVGAHLRGCWHMLSQPPDLPIIQGTIERLDSSRPAGATLVFLGAFAVPDPGDYRLEPEIVPPTSRAGKLRSVRVALQLGTWLGLVVAAGHAANTTFVLVNGAWILMVGGFLLWKYLLRPTYLRAAPGVVQVITYHPLRAKPSIRTYPIDSGTLCVLVQTLTGATLTLWRGDDTDTAAIEPAGPSSELIERLLHALVSTAPTPPLSTEELAG